MIIAVALAILGLYVMVRVMDDARIPDSLLRLIVVICLYFMALAVWMPFGFVTGGRIQAASPELAHDPRVIAFVPPLIVAVLAGFLLPLRQLRRPKRSGGAGR
jgi:hypothetical protein